MKTWKQFAALLLACTMMLPVFSCAHGSSASEGESSGNQEISINDEELTKIELTGADDVVNDEKNNVEEDPTVYIVTTLRGDDGTFYVQQTDINGTTVTDRDGAAVTEVYTGTTLATTYITEEGQTYTPAYKNYQAFWLDMSKKADFVFDGELLTFDLKIADDAVDGVYPVQFYFADVANWDAQTLSDITMNVGYVCINADAPALDQPTGTGLTINPGIATGAPGETVKLSVNIANNPGFVGFRLRMRYDSNAFTITDLAVGETLEEYAGASGKDYVE